MLEMRQRFKRGRHHMKNGPLFVRENLLCDLERGLRFASRQIEHLRFTILVMFDELIGAVTMVLVDEAMRGQHMLDVEFLNFQLRIDEISEWIARRIGIQSDM